MPRRSSVVVLERDDDSRKSLAEVLRIEGYDVREAVEPPDAITESLGTLPPDVVVANVWGAEGADLVMRLKVNRVGVVVFTGQTVPLSDRLRLLANAVVLKPKMEELLVELRRLCAPDDRLQPDEEVALDRHAASLVGTTEHRDLC